MIGPRPRPDHPDRGSVTPLIIGMVLLLLILGVGVTAAGSAFLAGQRLQRLCDGAAVAAGNAIEPGVGGRQSNGAAVAAAQNYLAPRGADVSAVIDVADNRATLSCSNEPSVAFGWVFGSPTVHRATTAVSEPVFRG